MNLPKTCNSRNFIVLHICLKIKYNIKASTFAADLSQVSVVS